MAAPAWKRILKWSAALFGGLLAIPIVAYVALVLINWRDQPPSEAALRLEANHRNRPMFSDTDNAYVYVMGFEVAPDLDPREAGLRRIAWIRTLPEEATYPVSGDPVTIHEEYRSSRSPRVRKISEACRTGSQDCSAALADSDDEIRAWVASEQWLLDRYLTLLQHPGWVETEPFDARIALTNYSKTLDGQKLLISNAYLLAGQKDAAAVRELLGNDVRFWRRVLASSDTLITKMIAASALYRTFGMGNLAMRRLPPELQLAAMPPEWTTPLTDEERSMLRCLTGEWIAGSQMLERTMAAKTPWFDDKDPETEDDFFATVMRRASDSLFQLQDFKNFQAELFIQATDALNVPLDRFSEGLEEAQSIFDDTGTSDNLFTTLYNPTGRVIVWLGTGSYTTYPPRVSDIEGIRRAAVLTTELRARRVAPQNIPSELASSQTRTPYTGAPFTWNAEEAAVMFIGMEPGERGRHTFKY